MIRRGPLEDGALRFTPTGRRERSTAEALAG
jgi:hypothetical protein